VDDEPGVWRMGPGLRRREADDRAARPPDSPRAHPDDARAIATATEACEEELIERPAGGGYWVTFQPLAWVSFRALPATPMGARPRLRRSTGAEGPRWPPDGPLRLSLPARRASQKPRPPGPTWLMIWSPPTRGLERSEWRCMPEGGSGCEASGGSSPGRYLLRVAGEHVAGPVVRCLPSWISTHRYLRLPECRGWREVVSE